MGWNDLPDTQEDAEHPEANQQEWRKLPDWISGMREGTWNVAAGTATLGKWPSNELLLRSV